ncbi:uncharacterized protein METZ01_LOCUS278864, partial [marine metagenome]
VAGSRRNLSAEIRRVSGETITVRYRRYKAKKWRWVDATGHPVTYTWLNMALVAAPFPITASRPPWASASGRHKPGDHNLRKVAFEVLGYPIRNVDE